MTAPTRDDVLIQLDKIDTALEAPEANKSDVIAQAHDWLAANPSLEPADALYYRERLQAIRERHKVG